MFASKHLQLSLIFVGKSGAWSSGVCCSAPRVVLSKHIFGLKYLVAESNTEQTKIG